MPILQSIFLHQVDTKISLQVILLIALRTVAQLLGLCVRGSMSLNIIGFQLPKDNTVAMAVQRELPPHPKTQHLL